jgi:putative transposase
MNLLTENTVLQWLSIENEDSFFERVLWTSRIKNTVVLIRLKDEKALPECRPWDEIELAIHTGNCKVIDWQDTNIPTGTDDQFEQKHLDIRNKAWDAIESIVKDEPDCYDSRLRGVMVQEIIAQTGLHKSTIYRYLRRFWQGGKVKNALLPFYQIALSSGFSCPLPGKACCPLCLYSAIQRYRVLSLIPSSRATCATGLPSS